MKRLILAFVVLAAVLPAVALAGTWNIDPVHSSVGFKIRHFFTKVGGTFTDYAGTIEFDPENPEAAKVKITIQAASINTNNEKRDGHLQSEDFFWVEKNPELTFRSTKVTKKGDGFLVEGLLTMRGVEKTVVLEAEFLGAGPDGWGGTRAGFTASTKVNRKDWGINWNKTLDQGGTVLSDDVTINLEIESILQEDKPGE
jgi:polyisoprenoid-binding protein YceI